MYNISRSTAERWMASPVPPSQVVRKQPTTPRSLTAKRTTMAKRQQRVNVLAHEKTVRVTGKRTSTTLPFQSAQLIARKLELERVASVSKSTIRRDLKKLGFSSRVRRLAPEQHAGDAEKRVAFCTKLQKTLKSPTKPKILWSDEKKFDSQDHGNRKQCVRPGERPLPRNRSQAADSVHVWGCISLDSCGRTWRCSYPGVGLLIAPG